MEHWWNDNERGNTEVLGGGGVKVTVPFSPSQIPHGLNVGLNPSLRSGILATDHLNHGRVRFLVIYKQNNWAFRVKLTRAQSFGRVVQGSLFAVWW